MSRLFFQNLFGYHHNSNLSYALMPVDNFILSTEIIFFLFFLITYQSMIYLVERLFNSLNIIPKFCG